MNPVRVVAGVARGRQLRAPAGRATRPTADRVREAMFNMLQGVCALDGADVVDLFAGSGALGVEALSRGAATATFVESDRLALEAIRANLATVGAGVDRGRVVRGDAPRWVRDAVRRGVVADVVFADPPYAFDGWAALAPDLAALAPVAVVESSTPPQLGDAWAHRRQRRYGATVVTIATAVPPSTASPTPKGGL